MDQGTGWREGFGTRVDEMEGMEGMEGMDRNGPY